MTIKTGTKVTWNSAAGKLTGTVKSVTNGLNAADKMVPWILLERVTKADGMPLANTMLCGTSANLTMMNLTTV